MKILIRAEITILIIVGILAAVKLFVPKEILFFWKSDSTVAAPEPETEIATNAGITVDTEGEAEAENVEAEPTEISEQTSQAEQAELPEKEEEEQPVKPEPVIDMTTRTDIEISDAVTAKLSELTTEQKVSQLFLVSPEALAGTGLVEKAGDRTARGIKKHAVGGVVYSTANGRTDKQLSKIIVDTQALFDANAPLQMIVGGTVAAGKTDMVLSTTTSADAVIPVIVKKSLEAAKDGAEVAKRIEDFDPKANGYSIYKCQNLNIITGTKPNNVSAALLKNGDLIYVTTNLDKYYNAVLKAVEKGELTKEQIDAIAGRVLAVKMAMPKQPTTLVE